MATPLRFLPVPASVEMGDGEFFLEASTSIQLGASVAANVGAVRSLQDAVAELTGLRLAVGDSSRSIALSVNDGSDPQSYVLDIRSDRITIDGAGQAGLFYGVQTLIQVLQNRGRVVPALTIRDRPVFPVRGVMLDVSRGKVPTNLTLSRLVDRLAQFKFNHLQLYFEHTFAFPNHPEIGAGADPLTQDDIRALDRQCRDLHIELMPNLQSIGHQRPLLRLPEFQDLAETPWHWSFSSVNDEGFALIDKLYGDMLEAFSSDTLNVDADEPWDFGRGASKARAAEIGLGRLYLEHVKRLHGLLAKRGKRMAMWADMFWHYPELIGELPDDILLLDWWYESRPSYRTVDALKRSGREFYVCAATSSWSTLFPRMNNAIANIRDYAKAGAEAGATGMLVTDWGDNGHFQPYSNSWHAFLLAADAGWTGATTPLDVVDDAIGHLFLRDASGRQVAAIRRLGAAMQVAPDWFTSWHSAMALYEDPLVGKMWSLAPRHVVAESREAALALQRLLHEVHDDQLRHDLGFVTDEIIFACDKVENSRRLRELLERVANDAINSSELAAGLRRVVQAMRTQRDRLPGLRLEFEKRWLSEARPSEIRGNLERFDALMGRFDAAIEWIDRQVISSESGQPIDVTLTGYDRGDYAVLHEATRKQIAELVGIIGIENIPPDLVSWVDVPADNANQGKKSG